MTTHVPGFDDSLHRALEECARDAGEDVGTYVARAVGAQMMADLMRAEKPSSKDLLVHMSEVGVFAADAMPDVSATVNDPPARLQALYATGLLDSPPEEKYDRITRAAADALDAPFAAISLIDVDRQFFQEFRRYGRDGPRGKAIATRTIGLPVHRGKWLTVGFSRTLEPTRYTRTIRRSRPAP